MFRAVCFDLGGVVFDSPFEALAELEVERGLEPGSINRVIVAGGAWAANERGEIAFDEFLRRFEDELGAAGLAVGAAELMARIRTKLRPRPAMLRAIERIREAGLLTAAITNNWREADGSTTGGNLVARFDVFVESATSGLHKPDPAIYRLALDLLGVEATEAVFLDDVGRNLKSARALGMTTIKVDDPDEALAELQALLGFGLA
ncbi:MAG: HAD family phosphatase [Acidimicrobiia bacterium]